MIFCLPEALTGSTGIETETVPLPLFAAWSPDQVELTKSNGIEVFDAFYILKKKWKKEIIFRLLKEIRRNEKVGLQIFQIHL